MRSVGSVRSVRCCEGELEEWRCLLVARLKVYRVAERGPGSGRASGRASVRWLREWVVVVN